MMRDLLRLLRPESVAVIGGGDWCGTALAQLERFQFKGPIWHVHPSNGDFASIGDLPHAPDAAFIGINGDATVTAVSQLARIGAGGAVCFASGFGEVSGGDLRNQALLEAAGEMPILGPNCYGFINALDGGVLWPDQHGCRPVDAGVAILTQSSNIAINLTMQARGLPIAYVITCGNQAQTSQAEIARTLLGDDRVTAIGLHIEGFGDLSVWDDLAREAHRKGVPLVAIKIGRSGAAQEAAISHTASLAGSDAGAQAVLDHLGIARLDDLSSFLETLKLLHVTGPLASDQIATISCSGGEASLSADLAETRGLRFPPLSETQVKALSGVLGPKVSLANPLDYHTYIWRDTEAMADAFSAMIEPHLGITMLIVDFPRTDLCDDTDWECAVAAALTARARTGAPIAMVATLPELMPETRAAQLMQGGVVPICGLSEAMNAVVAAQIRAPSALRALSVGAIGTTETLTEAESKAHLAAFGLSIPAGKSGNLTDLLEWAAGQPGPFALKSTGFAHKTDAGGVALNLTTTTSIRTAAADMPGDSFLLEQMIPDPVAELLIGVTYDPAHGHLLTIGAGGILTELLEDSQTLLIPATPQAIEQALSRLKVAKMLGGYRGKPAADLDSILAAISHIQDYILANRGQVAEVEVNPLICTPTQAIAADALIRRTP